MNISAINPNLIIYKYPAYKFTTTSLHNAALYEVADIVSFSGRDYSNIKPIDLSQATDISGIHCPGCGIKMFSQQNYEELVEKAENIHSTKDLVEILKEYKEFIPNNMKDILSYTEDSYDYEDLTIREYYTQHRQEAYRKKKERIHTVKEFLRKYSENVNPNLQENFLNEVENINNYQDYEQYKEKIIKLIENYDFTPAQKNIIKQNCLKDIASTSNYLYIFNVRNFSEIPDEDLGKIIVKRVFYPSVNKIAPIEKYPEYIDHPHNKLLLCRNCNASSSKYVFWKNDSNPHLKNNINKYLSDLSILMGQNRLEYNPNYFSTFIYFSKILSSGKIEFSVREKKSILNLYTMAGKRDIFAPIEQTKTDIPCAQCGSTMLPHAIRSNINDDLLTCSNPFEYFQVLGKYKKYIGVYAQDAAKIFTDIVRENPSISNEELIKELRKRADKHSEAEMKDAIIKYLKNRDYVSENQKEILPNFDKLANRVITCMKEGKMSDYNYKSIFAYCTSDMNINENFSKSMYVLLYDLHKICYKNSLAKADNIYSSNDKDEVYTLMFNLFKSDVATANHLITAAKGGENSKDNLIGLCKGCSGLKSKKSISSWYSQNLDVRKNFLNHVKTIDSMAKKGQLTDYDDWAKNIAQTMYDGTYNAYDIRGEFE